jgi:transcriptional regulator with XRE-family HTH domain
MKINIDLVNNKGYNQRNFNSLFIKEVALLNTLSKLRLSAGYKTQADFARALGVKDRAVVAKWETGNSYPRAPLIPQIAGLLDVSEGEVIASIEASKREKPQNLPAIESKEVGCCINPREPARRRPRRKSWLKSLFV